MMRMLDATTANRAVKGDEGATEELILALRDNSLDDLARIVTSAIAEGYTSSTVHLNDVPEKARKVNELALAEVMDHMRDLGYKVTYYSNKYVIDWSSPEM